MRLRTLGIRHKDADLAVDAHGGLYALLPGEDVWRPLGLTVSPSAPLVGEAHRELADHDDEGLGCA